MAHIQFLSSLSSKLLKDLITIHFSRRILEQLTTVNRVYFVSYIVTLLYYIMSAEEPKQIIQNSTSTDYYTDHNGIYFVPTYIMTLSHNTCIYNITSIKELNYSKYPHTTEFNDISGSWSLICNHFMLTYIMSTYTVIMSQTIYTLSYP